MANRWENNGNSDRLFGGAPKSLQKLTATMKLKDACPQKKSYDQPRQYIKKQRHYFANKGPSSQTYGFSSGHVWMWELDYKENWVLENWWFWTVVLEKTLESPLDYKEIQPVHSKWDQSWVFFGRTDVEAETPILWPPHVKSWLIWKDPDAGRDWGQKEKRTTEDETVGWHHWLNGHRFGWTLGVGAVVHGVAESDTTERLNWTELDMEKCIHSYWKRSLKNWLICISSYSSISITQCSPHFPALWDPIFGKAQSTNLPNIPREPCSVVMTQGKRCRKTYSWGQTALVGLPRWRHW